MFPVTLVFAEHMPRIDTLLPRIPVKGDRIQVEFVGHQWVLVNVCEVQFTAGSDTTLCLVTMP